MAHICCLAIEYSISSCYHFLVKNGEDIHMEELNETILAEKVMKFF